MWEGDQTWRQEIVKWGCGSYARVWPSHYTEYASSSVYSIYSTLIAIVLRDYNVMLLS